MIRRHPHTAGFTLIELLVAGTICAVLLGSLFALLFGMLKLREKTYEAAESGRPRQQVIQILRRDLMNAVSPNGLVANAFTGGTGNTANTGVSGIASGIASKAASFGSGDSSQETLEFYSTTGVLSDSYPWSEVQKIDYYLQSPADAGKDAGMDLIRKTTRNLYTSTPVDDPDQGQWLLLHGVQSLTFEYYDPDNTTWQTTWDSTQLNSANPSAVRMHLDFVDPQGSERTEPPIEIVCPITCQPRPSTTSTSTE